MMKILFPESTLETPTIDGVEVVRFDPKAPIPKEHTDADGLVVWEMGPKTSARVVAQLPDLAFTQLLTAGVDQVPTMGFKEDVRIAGGSGLHNEPVAEHALALMLAVVRGLDDAVRAKIGKRWAWEWDAAGQNRNGSPISLRGANVLIWGYGNIGRELASYLVPLGANVSGVATTRRTEDIEVYPAEDLPDLLPNTDVLVMILPAGEDTRNALNEEVLDLLPSNAYIVNVGRGATVDEEALSKALTNREIGGAALDVMQVEPLPVSSPLWDVPNLIITPHNAGGRPLGWEKLLEENIAAWQAGEPLVNEVS